MAANVTNETGIHFDPNANDTAIYLNSNGTEAFITSLIISAALGLLFILIASCLRSRLNKIYTPRVLLIDTLFPLGKLPNSFFAWIIPGWMARDDDIFNYAGFDALVYIRFLKLCLKCAVVTMPYSILVLLPLNLYGGGPNHEDVFTRTSMSNVSQHSTKLWAHFFAVWIYSLLLFYLIFQEWKMYILYKQADLSRGLPHQHTVLVKDLPENLRNQDSLKDYLNEIFDDQVETIVVVNDLTNWRNLINEHNELVWKLERAKAIFDQTQERPEHKTRMCGGTQVDSISTFEQQLNDVQSLLEQDLEKEHEATPCALVMFKSLRGASIATQMLWDILPFKILTEPAPEPHNVIWDNLKMRLWKRWLLTIVSKIILFLVVIFWLVPVALLASILSLQNLTDIFTWLEPVLDWSPFVKGFLEGFLPCIGLYIFFAVLPLIMYSLSKCEGLVSNGALDVSVICKLYIFKVFNQFLILVLSGSILKSLSGIIEKPLELPLLLGRSLPSMSSFFINYTLIGAFLIQPLELSRLVPMIIVWIKKKWLVKTPREEAAAWRPPKAPYHALFPENLFIFIVGVCYSVIAPLITPFFVFYFGMAYFVWTNQVMCVYIPNYMMGGSVWPYASSRMLVAMSVFQVLMIGIFALKEDFLIMSLTAPLPFLTLCFYFFIQNYFSTVSKHLALTTTTNAPEPNAEDMQEAADNYKQTHIPPVYELTADAQFKIPEEVHCQTIATIESADPDANRGPADPDANRGPDLDLNDPPGQAEDAEQPNPDEQPDKEHLTFI